MHVSKVKLWVLLLLLFVYLAGVLLLSAVTLHEPNRSQIYKVATGGGGGGGRQAYKSKSYEYGVPGLRPSLRGSRIQWCSELKFLDPPKGLVALASFPGSGNTWLRYLLQQATGYYTGSVYKDYGLLKNGFPAENVVNGSVLVVKTHEWGPNARKAFSKAILLVRDPAASIQAEFNRQSGGHIGFAAPDRYKRTKGKFWQQFVKDKLHSWQTTNLDWLYNFTGPTHVIFYQQLVHNLEHTLRSVVDFLEVPLNEPLFRCAVERQEGIYRRKRRLLAFDPYTADLRRLIRSHQAKVYDAIYGFASPAAAR